MAVNIIIIADTFAELHDVLTRLKYPDTPKTVRIHTAVCQDIQEILSKVVANPDLLDEDGNEVVPYELYPALSSFWNDIESHAANISMIKLLDRFGSIFITMETAHASRYLRRGPSR